MEKVEKKLNIENKIIDAAREVFSRYGFKKATMDEIAFSIHMGKSSLYYYFKNKEDIFEAVIEKESIFLKQEIMAAVDKEKDTKSKLRSYIKNRLHIISRLSNYYSIIKDEYLSHYVFIEKLREKHLRDEVSRITTILKDGVKEKSFLIKDIEITAYTIITALKGLEHSWSNEESFFRIDDNIDGLIDILFNGICRE